MDEAGFDDSSLLALHTSRSICFHGDNEPVGSAFSSVSSDVHVEDRFGWSIFCGRQHVHHTSDAATAKLVETND